MDATVTDFDSSGRRSIVGPRRRAIVAIGIAATLGLSACGGAPETPSATAAASRATSAATQSAPSATGSEPTPSPDGVAGAIAPLDPGRFEHGDFVGALQIDYLGNRTSESARFADQAYNDFFDGSYDSPGAGKSVVLRLTAMGDPRDGDRLLRLGAVIDNITPANSLVIGLHNVMDVQGAVELNGQVHDARVAGASGVLEIGDRVTIWVAEPDNPGTVERYVYEAVSAEGGDSPYTIANADANIDSVVYRASPSPDVFQLSTYICWPPNQLAQRLVTRLQLVESSLVPGSVSPVETP